MNREQRILQKLQALTPAKLELKNESHKHAGHIEHSGSAGFTGETHYKLQIECEKFTGQSRIDRQRLIMDLLKDEFVSGLHALKIKARAPGEA